MRDGAGGGPWRNENEDINCKRRHLIKQITGQALTGRGKREFVAKCEGWGRTTVEKRENEDISRKVRHLIKQITGQALTGRGEREDVATEAKGYRELAQHGVLPSLAGGAWPDVGFALCWAVRIACPDGQYHPLWQGLLR